MVIRLLKLALLFTVLYDDCVVYEDYLACVDYMQVTLVRLFKLDSMIVPVDCFVCVYYAIIRYISWKSVYFNQDFFFAHRHSFPSFPSIFPLVRYSVYGLHTSTFCPRTLSASNAELSDRPSIYPAIHRGIG